MLQEDESLARQAFGLVLHVMFARRSSMASHSDAWPGLLALALSTDPLGQTVCLDLLRQDYATFQAAASQPKTNLFVHKVVKKSPFQRHLHGRGGCLCLRRIWPA